MKNYTHHTDKLRLPSGFQGRCNIFNKCDCLANEIILIKNLITAKKLALTLCPHHNPFWPESSEWRFLLWMEHMWKVSLGLELNR